MTIQRRRADDAYEPVRAASRQRQNASHDFQKAMDASPPWIRAAIRRYCAALRDEAAAYRVEARTHRLLLEELSSRKPIEQDTEEES